MIDLASGAACARELSAVGSLIGSLEIIAGRRHYATGGIFSQRVFTTRSAVLADARVAPFAGALFSAPGVVRMHLVKAAAAALLIVPGFDPAVYAAALALTLLLHCLWVYRTVAGADGSDQMLTVVTAGLLVYFLAPHELAGTIGLAFIAAQALLAYTAAGVSKLLSPVWRSGRALRLIFGTASYGSERLLRVLEAAPVLDRIGGWATIVFECTLPAAILLPPDGALALLGLGVAFHAACALTMGLNGFFWQFVATYPVIAAFSGRLIPPF